MSVNLISGECFHCGERIVMDSCLKMYACEDFKNLLLDEQNIEKRIENCKKFSRYYLHRDCKQALIEEINAKVKDSINF